MRNKQGGIKVNLNNEINKIIHRGRKDVNNLYAKIDTKRKYDEREAEVIRSSSPTNIQSVFIGERVIASMHVMSDSIKYASGKLPRLEVGEKCTGDVFSVFNSPYTLNNIEEIYLGNRVLMSEEFCSKAIRFGVFPNIQYIQDILSGNIEAVSVNNSSLIKMFMALAFNEGDKVTYGNNPSRKFPRLKIIAFISRLDSIMYSNKVYYNTINSKVDDYRNSRESRTFFEETRDIRAQIIPNSVDVVSTVDYGRENLEFKIKDNQYVFDRFILRDRVDRYKGAIRRKDLNENKRENVNQAVREKEGKPDKGYIEQEIKRAEAKYGKEAAGIIARTIRNIHISDGDIASEISEESRKTWRLSNDK